MGYISLEADERRGSKNPIKIEAIERTLSVFLIKKDNLLALAAGDFKKMRMSAATFGVAVFFESMLLSEQVCRHKRGKSSISS